jgi:hypothetical protein
LGIRRARNHVNSCSAVARLNSKSIADNPIDQEPDQVEVMPRNNRLSKLG